MSRREAVTIPTRVWLRQRYVFHIARIPRFEANVGCQNPPLYLHVTSTSKAGLEQAVAKIEEMMKQELPNLVDERRFRRRDQEQVERDEFGRRKWPEAKIPISLDPVPGFNLRAQVVGSGGSYVKHIQQETGCRVQIKGRGSGYLEAATNRESDEDMFLHVAWVPLPTGKNQDRG